MLRGGNDTLRCVATGYPMPQVTWLHDGIVLPSDTRVNWNQNVTDQEVESVVYMSLVTEEDSGNYTCRVTVPGYQTISQSELVHVLTNTSTPEQSSPTTPEQSSPTTPEQSSPTTPEQSAHATPEQSAHATPEQRSTNATPVKNTDTELMRNIIGRVTELLQY